MKIEKKQKIRFSIIFSSASCE